jgi:hypothetical protein
MRYTILITILFSIFSCVHNSTSKNSTINHDSLIVETFLYSECLENCKLKSRLLNQSLVDNTYRLSFGVHLNCAGDFISNVNLTYDTLRIIIDIKPSKEGLIHEATCNCFYQFDYLISGINQIPKEILINGLTFQENFDQNNETDEIEPNK